MKSYLYSRATKNEANMNVLRNFWKQLFEYNWTFGIFLIVLFGVPRFILVLNANSSGSGYGFVSIIFVVMWFAPLIFLTKKGRKEIGIKIPDRPLRLLYSFVLGAASCAILFFVTNLLFGTSLENSFFYISKSYSVPVDALNTNRFMIFILFAFYGMIFSPIGEELLYRGVVHGSFVSRFGENKASIFDAMAFGLTHLAHFGIIYHLGNWSFLFIPALLWVLFMFAVSRLFFKCKQMCNSIFGAMASHAGFNIAMMYFIVYYIL
jgi:hypothetical protein